jgi:hypothetical protein
MRIYVDGCAVATRPLHNTNSNRSSAKFGGTMQVGASKHVGNWKGRIADLRFYTQRTLSHEQALLLAVRDSIAEIAALPAERRSPSQAQALRAYFLEHAASTPLRQLAAAVRAAKDARRKFHDSLPTTMVMEEMDPPRETFVRVRGVYHQFGLQVSPAVPAVFPALVPEYPRNRLGLAHWLVDGDHPLTARVAVNRYWQLMFGQGLVQTPEDFGVQGDPPTHPRLLDWLAVDFVESGWDIQRILKQMVMSATYRQSSQVAPQLLVRDPDNRLLARAPRPRLPANVLRDQALAVSGLLIERQGGPSVKPYQPAGLWREASNFRYQVGKGEQLYRRSLYSYWKRTLAPPSMAVLDAADREWCSVKPKRTNTPLQALTLLNETAFFEAARKFAERILSEGGADTDRQIEFAFRTVTARKPSDAERGQLIEAWEAYLAAFQKDLTAAKRVLAVGQSPANPTLDPISLAATTALANVLLNLDEVTTRE